MSKIDPVMAAAARRCSCPECTARAAALLLECGRPSMALSLVRDLPEAQS